MNTRHPASWILISSLIMAFGACKSGTQPEPAAQYALHFDGVDDYIQVPDQNILDFGTGDFTWEVWLKRSRVGVREDVLSKKDVFADSEHDMVLFIDDDDRARAFFRDFPFQGTTLVILSEVRVDTAWTHIAVTRAEGIAQLYINGILQRSVAAPVNISSSGPFRIGANRLNNEGTDASPVFPFEGLIREVRAWNVARASRQIAESALPCNSLRDTRGLVAHYRFDEGSGETVRDVSENGNGGALRNGPVWVTIPPLCTRD